MQLALQEANEAGLRGEIPIGAVIVDASTDKVIASFGNMVEELKSATAHAEILSINQACKILGNSRLNACDLYVTLEPCAMCATAISLAKIRRLYFGAASNKTGAVVNGARIFSLSNCNHQPEVYDNIMEKESSMMIKKFFTGLR